MENWNYQSLHTLIEDRRYKRYYSEKYDGCSCRLVGTEDIDILDGGKTVGLCR